MFAALVLPEKVKAKAANKSPNLSPSPAVSKAGSPVTKAVTGKKPPRSPRAASNDKSQEPTGNKGGNPTSPKKGTSPAKQMLAANFDSSDVQVDESKPRFVERVHRPRTTRIAVLQEICLNMHIGSLLIPFLGTNAGIPLALCAMLEEGTMDIKARLFTEDFYYLFAHKWTTRRGRSWRRGEGRRGEKEA